MLTKMSTKWMVDVITLSNRARYHLCCNKSEQGLVLNNERYIICHQSFCSYPKQILVIYVVLLQRIDKK